MKKILCITDPTTHPAFDTTVELYQRLAEDERVELFHAPVLANEGYEAPPCVAVGAPLPYERFLELDILAATRRPLASFDLVFLRADKPYPPSFLERLAEQERHVRFVNRPSGLVEVSRRTFCQDQFPQLLPEFIVSRDAAEICAFLERHGAIVAKKDVSYGGKGVFKVWRDGDGYSADNITTGTKHFASRDEVLAFLLSQDNAPFECVKFLRNIAAGDKRVLVVDGEIYGGFLRKSSNDHWVHNITSGGTYERAEVTAKEREIVEQTAPSYRARGVSTLGYDFLMQDDGSWGLSEINAGNIGGYGRLQQLTGEPVFERLIDWLLSTAS